MRNQLQTPLLSQAGTVSLDPHVEEPARLQLEHVSVSFGGRLVLEDISCQVEHGDQVAIVGPNGAGKSTLFKALVGLVSLHSGQILIHGYPLGHHRDCVAYLPQREEVDWRFPVTVRDVVMMGRFRRMGWLRSPRPVDREAVELAMAQLDIASLANRPIGELSGGQQQRAFLARALAQEPHLLLLDEPFTGVDSPTQEATLALLDGLRGRGVTVLVSTHDLSLAADRFSQVLLLNRRLVAFGPPAEVFQASFIRQAFGGQLLFLEGGVVVDQCCPPGEHEERHHL
jgi:manganese/iron transport system ATP-binding protein